MAYNDSFAGQSWAKWAIERNIEQLPDELRRGCHLSSSSEIEAFKATKAVDMRSFNFIAISNSPQGGGRDLHRDDLLPSHMLRTNTTTQTRAAATAFPLSLTINQGAARS